MIEQHRELGEQIAKAGSRLYTRALVAGAHGCISVRLNDGLIMITPEGASPASLAPHELCIVDENGKWLAGGSVPREAQTHFAIYRARRDIMACLRAYPPTTVAYSLKKDPPDIAALIACMPGLGRVALGRAAETEQAMRPKKAENSPQVSQAKTVVQVSRAEVAQIPRPELSLQPTQAKATAQASPMESAADYLKNADLVLLPPHGVFSVGDSVMGALYALESLEHAAVILRSL